MSKIINNTKTVFKKQLKMAGTNLSETKKDYSSAIINRVKNFIPSLKVKSRMKDDLMWMPDKKKQKAINNVNSLINKSNYSGARKYIASQNKIVKDSQPVYDNKGY